MNNVNPLGFQRKSPPLILSTLCHPDGSSPECKIPQGKKCIILRLRWVGVEATGYFQPSLHDW
jgi:hypothetical protein